MSSLSSLARSDTLEAVVLSEGFAPVTRALSDADTDPVDVGVGVDAGSVADADFDADAATGVDPDGDEVVLLAGTLLLGGALAPGGGTPVV